MVLRTTNKPSTLLLMTQLYFALNILLVMTIFGCANTDKKVSNRNSVTEFFANAERQFEAKSQCLELKKALNDMAQLAPAELQSKRYKNHQGQVGSWTATMMLEKYFVSTINMTSKDFYRDYQDPLAKKVLTQKAAALGDCTGAPSKS